MVFAPMTLPVLITAPAQIMLPAPSATSSATMLRGCSATAGTSPPATRLREHLGARVVVADRDDHAVVRLRCEERSRAQDAAAGPQRVVAARVVVEERGRGPGETRAAPRAEDIGHDLTVPTRTDDEDHRLALPMNSCAVAWPGWLMPSRVRTFQTVSASSFASSHGDRWST